MEDKVEAWLKEQESFHNDDRDGKSLIALVRMYRGANHFYGDINNWGVDVVSEGMLGETLIKTIRNLEYNAGERARDAEEKANRIVNK